MDNGNVVEFMIKSQNKVRSSEYIEWLYCYLHTHKSYSSYSLDSLDENDYENTNILDYFFSYLRELAKNQNVCIVQDHNIPFANEMVNVKIKDKYFEFYLIFGQGSLLEINTVQKNSSIRYVEI